MTERYESWLQNPTTELILTSHSAANLTPPEQSILETLVMNSDQLSASKYTEAMKNLGRILKNSYLPRNLVTALKIATVERLPKSGDPTNRPASTFRVRK